MKIEFSFPSFPSLAIPTTNIETLLCSRTIFYEFETMKRDENPKGHETDSSNRRQEPWKLNRSIASWKSSLLNISRLNRNTTQWGSQERSRILKSFRNVVKEIFYQYLIFTSHNQQIQITSFEIKETKHKSFAFLTFDK